MFRRWDGITGGEFVFESNAHRASRSNSDAPLDAYGYANHDGERYRLCNGDSRRQLNSEAGSTPAPTSTGTAK